MGCFFVCACENDMQVVQDLGKKKIGRERAEDVESLMSQGGRVKAKLNSPLMIRSQTDTPLVEFPETLHVIFYDDSTKPQSYLSAKYGRYLESAGKVFLKDSVVVYNITGDTLFTSELWWDRNKELFYTDKYVLISQPYGQKFEGLNGMTADQSFRSWSLINGRGVRNVADSSLPQ